MAYYCIEPENLNTMEVPIGFTYLEGFAHGAWPLCAETSWLASFG